MCISQIHIYTHLDSIPSSPDKYPLFWLHLCLLYCHSLKIYIEINMYINVHYVYITDTNIQPFRLNSLKLGQLSTILITPRSVMFSLIIYIKLNINMHIHVYISQIHIYSCLGSILLRITIRCSDYIPVSYIITAG
jgi:hypothetical protein